MDVPTYQQVLADLYEEAPRDVLVHQAEYEEEVPPEDNYPDELEDQEAFREFGGDRAAAGEQPAPPEFKDNTVQSIRYHSKDVLTRIINIDSRFRPDPSRTLSSEFKFTFRNPLKNIISMRVSGIEMPNTMYVFTKDNQNISFKANVNNTGWQTITIEEGNYENPDDLIETIQALLINTFPSANFSLSISPVTAKLTIRADIPFELDFGVGGTTVRYYDNGMGHHLGFKESLYPSTVSRTAERIINTIESNYVFLSLGSKYNLIEHSGNHLSAFAKILMDDLKNNVIFQNANNTVSDTYYFRYPTNITSLDIKVFDMHEKVVDFQGLDFSFTLEVEEIINHSLFQALNETH